MKNKHLVLLFLFVLLIGYLGRWLPWQRKQEFKTGLIRVDTAALTQVSIAQNGRSELLIERTEAGWAATQELRSAPVQSADIEPLLGALAQIHSLRIVKTNRPDTVGFGDADLLKISLSVGHKTIENFEIGNETLENGSPATYIHLNRHEGIYLVQNHLRGIFSKTLNDFRKNNVADIDPERIKSILIERLEEFRKGAYFIQKNDSTGHWELPGQPPPFQVQDDTVQIWLRLFSRLNGSPFADHFDESRARETFAGRITLYSTSHDSLVIRLFYVKPPDFPEEISRMQAPEQPVYVVHSTLNPLNFFAPPDTTLLHRMWYGLIPPLPQPQ